MPRDNVFYENKERKPILAKLCLALTLKYCSKHIDGGGIHKWVKSILSSGTYSLLGETFA